MEINQDTDVHIMLKEDGSPPYSIFGKFQTMQRVSPDSKTYILVLGTSGDLIGKGILIPEDNIKVITILGG